MCTICGCSDGAKATVTDLETGKTVELAHDGSHHDHNHDHDHGHPHHSHDHGDSHAHHHDGHAHTHAARHGTTLSLEADILAKNNRLAERNRGWFEGRGILSFNLVSSPGSGKTTLLERTITDLKGELPINVIEGDQETLNDAQRIKATGCKVVQINTGTGCHLEADMLARGLKDLNPPPNSIVMIENVGNLVCPALFDLGENCKVAILSVTEGEDKPIKYPHMFRAAQVMLLNKIDLLPHLNFDVEACVNYAKTVNPDIRIFQLSAISGQGLDEWYGWLKKQLNAQQGVTA
ncbi:hydrogenase nickel incorporation protein HypB [Methyloglobulus sp.]|uniref:hydrogenase nickel incorporation protein HypB n=1 Tax=Methyloglobulus sp. TaxID=2518622 RepID=UPI00398A2CC7